MKTKKIKTNLIYNKFTFVIYISLFVLTLSLSSVLVVFSALNSNFLSGTRISYYPEVDIKTGLDLCKILKETSNAKDSDLMIRTITFDFYSSEEGEPKTYLNSEGVNIIENIIPENKIMETTDTYVELDIYRINHKQDVYLLSHREIKLPSDLEGTFWYMEALVSIYFNNINTSNVTDMSYMFQDCVSLRNINLSGFDTSNVTNMHAMFYDCYKLGSLDLSGFDTSNVTDMGFMFHLCINLTNLDLSNFNTSSVTSMYCMFQNCVMTNLDLSSFYTPNLTDMGYMFSSCSNLTSLDLSGFDTSNVTNMDSLFRGCSALINLDLSGYFNTANAITLHAMFYNCNALTSLDLSNFNTASVTNMSAMFSLCSGLTSLDLSNFNTSNVTNMINMFFICSNLEKIYVGSDWSTANVSVTSSDAMFAECSKLPNYNSSYEDKTYAYAGSGGYLTLKT